MISMARAVLHVSTMPPRTTDPNVILAEIRRTLGLAYCEELDLERLADLVEELDEWICGGGALPVAWQRPKPPKRRLSWWVTP